MFQLWKCSNIWKRLLTLLFSQDNYVNIQKGEKRCIFSLSGLLRHSVLISVHRKNMHMSLKELFYIFLQKTCTETGIWLCCVLGFSRAWRWATRKLQTSTTYQGPCQRNKIKWGLCCFHYINYIGLSITQAMKWVNWNKWIFFPAFFIKGIHMRFHTGDVWLRTHVSGWLATCCGLLFAFSSALRSVCLSYILSPPPSPSWTGHTPSSILFYSFT